MYREFTERLIDTKSRLQKQLHDNKKDHKAIKDELLFKSQDAQKPIWERLEKNEREIAMIEAKIIRADRYGMHHLGAGKDLVCPECYVEMDETSELKDVKPAPINYMKRFVCKKCSFEICVEKPIGKP